MHITLFLWTHPSMGQKWELNWIMTNRFIELHRLLLAPKSENNENSQGRRKSSEATVVRTPGINSIFANLMQVTTSIKPLFTWINRKNIKSGCWAKNVSNTERAPTKHLLPKRHQMTFLHCALFQMCVTVWLQCSIPIGILHVSASSLTILMFSSLQFCHSLVFIYVFKWCIQLVWYVYIQCHVNILTANLIA